jgi:hypothetical protein
VKLPVPGAVMREFSVEGTARTFKSDTTNQTPDTISFYMSNTLQYGNVKAIRAQDIMVYDIVSTTKWQRPIYFAMTVAPDGMIGLRDFLRLEGLAFRLTPVSGQGYATNINEFRMSRNLFTDIKEPSKTPQLGFLWRGLQDSTTYFDEDVRRLMANYRQAFIILGQHYATDKNQTAKVEQTLDRMEERVPRRIIPMDVRTKTYVANLYGAVGNDQESRELSMEIVNELKPIVARGVAEPLSYDNPFVVLLQTYENLQMYDEALKLVDVIHATYSRERGIDQIAGQLRARIVSEKSYAARQDSAASGVPSPKTTAAPPKTPPGAKGK